MALQIWGEGFSIVLLVGFREAAVHELQRSYQQLQAAHLQDVTGNLDAVNARLSGLDFQCDQLMIGEGLKSFHEQVHPIFQVVAVQRLAKVVQGTPIKVAFVRLWMPNA